MIKKHLFFLCLLFSPFVNFAITNPQVANVSIYSYDIAGNQTLTYGQSGNIHFIFQNIGADAAPGVTVSLTTLDTYATLTNSTNIQLGSISGNSGIAEISTAFNLAITNDIPDQHPITLSCTISSSNGSSWTQDIVITANAPAITIGAVTVTNDTNGSSTLDPGETADFVYSVSNTGHADAIFSGLLTKTSDPNNYLTLGTTTVSTVSILAGQSSLFTFSGVNVSLLAPPESPVSINLFVSSPPIYENNQADNLLIGFTPTYCTSNSTNISDTRIDYVSFATIDNNTSGNGCASYSDFTTMNAPVVIGQTYPITVTLGSCGGNYTKGLIVFIDWNYDGDFLDANETAYTSPTTSPTATFNSTITVPSGISAGKKMMRVVCSEDELNINPCGTYSYGETEDYTLTVVIPTLPLADFTASTIQTTVSSTINFTDNSLNFPDNWLWSVSPGILNTDYIFTNGTSANSQNPQIQFLTAGLYSITLAATNGVGTDTKIKTDYVTILDITAVPTADFSASALDLAAGDISVFTDLSDQSPNAWLWAVTPGTEGIDWAFTNGTTASSQNPEIQFNTSGLYSVSLTSTNVMGVSAPTVKTDYISVRETILMMNGNITTCSATFYDTGGPTANYANSENLILTIHPGVSTNKVKVDFYTDLVTEACAYDYLNIYDGADNTAPLLGKLCGTATIPGIFIATNPAGVLTFEFISDGSVNDIGWEASVSCFDPNSVPNCVDTPFPVDMATAVLPTETTLSWNVQIADNYDIYVGETLPTIPTATVTTNFYTPTLLPNTNYVWKVVAKNANGSATGCPTWSFTTGESYRIANSQVTTCDAYLFDTGGETGMYGISEDYTMTFTPNSGGGMLQATFEGTFAVESCNYDFLRIYDGLDANAPLLGQFCGTTLPTTAIMANNINGALTFKFHSDGAGTTDGWKAHVLCSNVPLPDCALLSAPVQNQTNVSVSEQLTWAAASGATIYDVYFGTTLPATPTASVTDLFYSPNMAFNTTYQWKVVARGAGGQAQACETRSFTTSAQTYPMTNGTVSICSGVFLDSGGLTANYGNNEDYFMTFTPASPSNTLIADFRGDFGIDDCATDYLIVYNGTDFFAPVLGTFCASNLPLQILTATNPDGALTFQFHSNSSGTKVGWEAFVECQSTVNIATVNENGFGLFPNPSSGIFSVQLPSQTRGKIRVYNTAGVLVAQKVATEKYTNFDFSNFTKGLYFINIVTNGKTSTLKLILD